MGRRLAWLSAAIVVALACQEELTAPGACPDFCPSTFITVVDSVVGGAIVRDSSFRGYVAPHRATTLQVATDGNGPASWAVMRFAQFTEGISLSVGDTSDIVAVDSFRLQLAINDRSTVDGLALRVYRIPPDVDTLTVFADLEPFFDDTTLITTFQIADTAEAGDSVTAIIDPAALPTFDADERVVAMAIELSTPEPAFINLGSRSGNAPARLTRFAQVDSAGAEIVESDDTRAVDLNTFVFPPRQAPAENTLEVGGAPSARSILRVELPGGIVDSSSVVRATLVLVPSEPAFGAPGDTFTLQTEPLAADFGPKSPIVPTLVPGLGSAAIAVGSLDTVRIDITHIVQPWRISPSIPRSLMIRVRPEAGGLGELRFNSSRSPGGRPLLHVTYVPLIQP